MPGKPQAPRTISGVYCVVRIDLISEVVWLEPQLYLAKLMDVTKLAQVPPEQSLLLKFKCELFTALYTRKTPVSVAAAH